MVNQLTMYRNVEDNGSSVGQEETVVYSYVFAAKVHTKGDSFLYGLLVQGVPDIWQVKIA